MRKGLAVLKNKVSFVSTISNFNKSESISDLLKNSAIYNSNVFKTIVNLLNSFDTS